jgi:hypothetical protein
LVIALRFAQRDFCEQRKLSLSRHGHSVVQQGAFYQVFMFAEEEHAEIFSEEFGGERAGACRTRSLASAGFSASEMTIIRFPGTA